MTKVKSGENQLDKRWDLDDERKRRPPNRVAAGKTFAENYTYLIPKNQSLVHLYFLWIAFPFTKSVSTENMT